MYKYYCLNEISNIGLEKFKEGFVKTEKVEEADAILVRSASLHEMEFGEQLKVIGRAGAGVNNIPLEKCAEKGIVVFNSPGANANAVKELVIAGMLLASRDVIGGVNWVKEHAKEQDIAKNAEKQKKHYAGTEIAGKKLGVIGLGAIGVLVANAAIHLGMEVFGYDPYVSVDAAWQLSKGIRHTKSLDEIYSQCDYITIHVPALEDTKGMICKESISLMKEGVVILNYARDLLVNEEDMIEALNQKKVRRYVTDFATPQIAETSGSIVMPHLGASTEEAEDNCAIMAVKELGDFLSNGNIKNSVNYPNCDMGIRKGVRITIMHKNIPNMIGQFTSLLANENINISDMTNKSRKEYAYTLLDVDASISDEVESKIANIEGVLKVRVIS